uniref:Nuclear pore complex protein Nup85 n=1 Tax=Papaver somniferum TaxID=3469 RepID=A0A5B7LJT4_PAPSO|nr:nucleoporin Nup85-like protein [Papaver somniferum]
MSFSISLVFRILENCLVEAVAVLVSKMTRMRPGLSESFKTKLTAWEKWRGHKAELECSAFCIQCNHQHTWDGLRNLLKIMLGNSNSLTSGHLQWSVQVLLSSVNQCPVVVSFGFVGELVLCKHSQSATNPPTGSSEVWYDLFVALF